MVSGDDSKGTLYFNFFCLNSFQKIIVSFDISGCSYSFHEYCWKMARHTLKILRREHREIFKVYWTFFDNLNETGKEWILKCTNKNKPFLYSVCVQEYIGQVLGALILTKLTLSNSDWNQSTNYNSELIDWL